MAPVGTVNLVKFFIICAIFLRAADSISLTTKQPRTRLTGSSKNSTPAPVLPANDSTNNAQSQASNKSAAPLESASASLTTTTTKSPEGVALYRLRDRNTRKTCILLRTDAVVEVNFVMHGLPEQVDAFVPDDAVVKGNCDSDEDIASIELTWQWHALTLEFRKTPGGERWYLNTVELDISLDRPQLHGIVSSDKALRLVSHEMLMPTPVGNSFSCEEVDVDLETDPDDNPPKNVHGSLLLRQLQLQAFMHRRDNFSDPYLCRPQKYFRSETAPIAVGTTLAIAALGIVTGYSAYRYFKVKNVQYNAME